MNSKQLSFFIHIATCGSFSKAAELSYTTRSALLQQINSLEEEIGTPLFHRSSAGVHLTKAGEIFFQNAKFMLRYYDATVQKCQETALGTNSKLRVGIFTELPSGRTSECSVLFQKRFPEYEIQFIPFSPDSLIHHVTGDTLDVFESPRLLLPAGSAFRFFPLSKERACLLLREDHPLLAGKQGYLSAKDLQGLTLRIPHNCPQFLQVILELKQKEPGLSYENAPYVYYAVLEQAMKGQVYLIPESYGAKYAPLKCVPIAGELTIELGFSCRKEPTAALEEFLCTAKQFFHE